MCDTQQVGKDVAEMAGVEKLPKNVHFVNLRKYSAEQMKAAIVLYICLYHADIVIIDGIVDFCPNFNDVEASQNLVIDYLLKIADKYDCAIINVLHTNKTDNFNELRGHLGSFLEQKGVTVIKCEKNNDLNLVSVKFPTHRYAPLNEFHFSYNDNGMPIDGDDFYQENEEEKKRLQKEKAAAKTTNDYIQRSTKVVNILKDHNGSMKRTQLVKSAMIKLSLGKSSVNSLIKKMLEDASSVIKEEKSDISLKEAQ